MQKLNCAIWALEIDAALKLSELKRKICFTVWAVTRLSLKREVWTSNLRPIKSDTMLPTACHRCGISSKRAPLLVGTMTRKWAPPIWWTLLRNIPNSIMKDLIFEDFGQWHSLEWRNLSHYSKPPMYFSCFKNTDLNKNCFLRSDFAAVNLKFPINSLQIKWFMILRTL